MATQKNNGAELATLTAPAPLPGLSALAPYGGFSFMESFIDGVQNISPERKARKNIFMTDESKQLDRSMLKQKLNLWIDLLESSADQTEMLAKTEEKAELADSLLRKNLLRALTTSRNLERSYRALSLFYKNTEVEKVPNVTILNASLDQLTDLDNPIFIDKVAAEFKQNYDRLDLRGNYSLLIVPGFMRSNSILEKWAKVAHANKVMLITDFADLESSEDTIELFSAANLTGGDLYRSNVIMACNWLAGRGKVADVGEEEDLFVPPSPALGGKIYYTLMSQVTAGKKHGSMNEVDGVRFPLMKSELSSLERLGLVPMINEYGKVMAFSAKTLFNGDNIGLKTYSVVRVFDYIVKVLFDFLNRRAFENWNSQIEADLRGQIVNFLDSVKGPSKLIEKFKIVRFERDDKIKDQIYLDIRITPYFPAKSFVIRLDGRKGDDVDSPAWSSDYSEA
ncbi:DUF5458 family protein [Hymenobacter crusticola]|uniref:Type VI secretion system contractile sheath protein TssC n=1 Tax=Hymenobacter crusticola TaxID=1770526 RepID=A0A243WH24_9BACT|nr:DUF5458 family protein [Hymenobacter crusticola]OUJ74807.1 type VI secretion system contractile sheath protein TssC [Hymenobacter crusticola]